MTISIHQPNLCPYYPFFQKIEQSDLFVILTQCQYEKGGYQSRFDFNGWHTMSVNRGLDPLITKNYVNPKRDWQKITSKFPNLKKFDHCIEDNLVVTNTNIIQEACNILAIKTPIIPDFETELTGTERLVEICKVNKATRYLSGVSGLKYLDIKQFERTGIEVIFQSNLIKKSFVEFI